MALHFIRKFRLLVFVALLVTFLFSCKKGQPPFPPPEAGFVEVKQQKTAIYSELPARVSAFLVAEVRPQVSGIILKRYFEEGDDVREGQRLYLIDPAPFQAAYENAKAALARAQANFNTIKNRYERYQELIKTKAISQQEFDDVEAAYKQSQAEIDFYNAALRSAEINLNYTEIKAPISGRIGKSEVTVGALVTQGQPMALTTIQKIDKVFVDATQSSSELFNLQSKIRSGAIKRADEVDVKLILENGSEYPEAGSFKFSDITVNEYTGSLTLRTVFENKDKLLLPGMFVRIKVEEGIAEKAILVPQRGVLRDPRGRAYVLLIDSENKAAQQFIEVERTIGSNWLVTKGIKEGDKIIVEGLQSIRDGMVVNPVPFEEKKEI
ncbi:MAG: efflux RND transporter periplasmic adaptor subunit [Acidobacteriota bacterium]